MKNKTILITGASKGIGQGIAIAAAKNGYSAVIHYGKDEAGANQTLEAVMQNGGQGRVLSFDISNREQVARVLNEDMEKHGAYYGVVLNAGIARDNAFPALEDEDWDLVVNTNLNGFYNVLKPVVMPMVRTKQPGRIIAMSSVSGVMGNRGQVNYSATKAGIIGAAKALAVELAKRKITVNVVAPGLVDTDMISQLPLDEILKTVPMNRVATLEEIAGPVMFLLSDEAAYITRQVIQVNGGMF